MIFLIFLAKAQRRKEKNYNPFAPSRLRENIYTKSVFVYKKCYFRAHFVKLWQKKIFLSKF